MDTAIVEGGDARQPPSELQVVMLFSTSVVLEKTLRIILATFFVSICLTTSCAWADENSKPLDSSDDTSNSSSRPATSGWAKPGPLENERTAMLTNIQKAKERGIGIQAYMAAHLDLESRVEKGATPEDIRKKLDSLESALKKQLSLLGKGRESSQPAPETGILGLKFKINAEKFPEVMTVVDDSPAAMAQLKAEDVIMPIDGCATKNLDKEIIYTMLVGQPCTKVNLTILRNDTTLKKTLTRIRGEDFAKLHPDIWNLYLTTM